MEAQSTGNKRQAISALERVLEKYDYSAPAGIHLPALLRCTTRLLQSELVTDGEIDPVLMDQLCTVFEGGKRHPSEQRKFRRLKSASIFTGQRITEKT